MPNDLSTSDVLTLLAKRRRRLLLQLLRDAGTPLPTTELAERIRDSECDEPASSDLVSIRLRLRHAHLPKLEEAAVVEYDESEGTVCPERNFGTLVNFLEKVGEEGSPCSDR
ncbi:DUF7344 domain-containing protein [Halorubrum depositum]|uniref:DUF7344 domain-containing protein n=1 Tax=Halorubrum depositum TaxID=2583992 RepID=UPI0011AA1620|nr:hypothetical protein [Halorubrum depositum]